MHGLYANVFMRPSQEVSTEMCPVIGRRKTLTECQKYDIMPMNSKVARVLRFCRAVSVSPLAIPRTLVREVGRLGKISFDLPVVSAKLENGPKR
jgi:hypothetical protein